jgi:hypothetical protein
VKFDYPENFRKTLAKWAIQSIRGKSLSALGPKSPYPIAKEHSMLRKLYIEMYFEELGLAAGVDVECQGTYASFLHEPHLTNCRARP